MKQNEKHPVSHPEIATSPADSGLVNTLLLDVKAVAKMLSLSPNSIWKQVAAGRMPKPIKIGASTRWKRADIERWLDGLGNTLEDEGLRQ